MIALSSADQLDPLRVDVQTRDLPARIGPRALADVVAFGRMLPPHRPGALTGAPVFIGGGGQLEIQYPFDLFETEPDFSLAFRQAAQVVFKGSVFTGHHYSTSFRGSHHHPPRRRDYFRCNDGCGWHPHRHG